MQQHSLKAALTPGFMLLFLSSSPRLCLMLSQIMVYGCSHVLTDPEKYTNEQTT